MAAKHARIPSIAGLEALAQRAPDLVLVHDAARPFVDAEFIDRAIAAGRAFGAAVPGSPVTDTIKVVDAGGLVVRRRTAPPCGPSRRRRPSGSTIS